MIRFLVCNGAKVGALVDVVTGSRANISRV